MLSSKRDFLQETQPALSWDDLGQGAPTIIGLARLCSEAMSSSRETCESATLSAEAQAILFAARERGVIVITGSNKAFDSVDRFLAVHVELDDDTVLSFKDKRNPKLTIRYLDAVRELCGAGLLMHHLYREFSLSRAGFELASQIKVAEVQAQLAEGKELGRHEW